MKQITLIIVFVVGMLAGVLLALDSASASATSCSSTYVVKRGDTLYRISRQSGTSVSELARMNNIWNPHRIYAGQVLCLTGPTVAEGHSNFDLVVSYTFDRDADPDAREWTLGRNRIAGKRVHYPLSSGDSIETFSTTTNVREASMVNTPLLWLERADAQGTVYTLVAIGDPQPLLNLQMEMTPTQSIVDIIPPPEPELLDAGLCPETRQPVGRLSLSRENEVTLTAELVTADGLFIPITITDIDYHETIERAASCYTEIGFALQVTDPTGSPDYFRLQMVLNDDDGSIGPPGYRWRSHCSRRWGGGGWWSSWRRSWFGC